ncbi:hypothetical protein NQ314_006157 [Rhamnusium bicolor]|uniref:Transcriptional coactivator p15 (PC4) C-terminal domain-containing protein n=1 Tax=Rhamnusium bicolor TaxID=1586634 RepID=A0AAV8Z6J3_9CUCU|nr:hypothetical protein NQ314_006157 [Rhamnusium bicolor]
MSECKAIKKRGELELGSKKLKKPTSETEQNARVSGEEENMWDLGNSHFIKLTEYGKKWYVNIRKFYNTDGAPKPGKDGIITDLEYMSMSTARGNNIDNLLINVYDDPLELQDGYL